MYMSRHGTTEKVALYLQQQLPFPVDLHRLDAASPAPDLQPYDLVVVGGSVYAGQIQTGIKDFCRTHQQELLGKQLGLFICCMNEKQAEAVMQDAYPEALRRHARATGVMGGELLFEKMSFWEKMVIRSVTGQQESVSKIKYAEIDRFAEAMAPVSVL